MPVALDLIVFPALFSLLSLRTVWVDRVVRRGSTLCFLFVSFSFLLLSDHEICSGWIGARSEDRIENHVSLICMPGHTDCTPVDRSSCGRIAAARDEGPARSRGNIARRRGV